MKTAKEYRDFFARLPEDMPVAFEGAWDCDIVGYKYSTDKGVVELIITSEYGITTKEFVDMMFNLAKR